MTATLEVRRDGAWESVGGADDTWTPPADWLTLPTPDMTQNKVVALAAVFPYGSNQVSISATGRYTVDWGDGSAQQTINTGVQVDHNFSYAGCTGLTTEGFRQAIVTVTPAQTNLLSYNASSVETDISDWVAMTNCTIGRNVSYKADGTASLSVDDVVGGGEAVVSSAARVPVTPGATYTWFASVGHDTSGTTYPARVGLTWYDTAGQPISTVHATADTTNASGGSFKQITSLVAVAPANAASALLLLKSTATAFRLIFWDKMGFYQGTVTTWYIPSTELLATVNLVVKPSIVNSTNNTSPWLDVIAYGLFPPMYSSGYSSTLLRRYRVLGVPSNVTSVANLFNGCGGLESVEVDTRNITNFTSMFDSCRSLRSAPSLDTSNGTIFKNMFYGCAALETVPSLDTSKGDDFSGMFSYCYALRTVPALDTHMGTNFGSMFTSCSRLLEVELDTSKGLAFGSMFNNTFCLTRVAIDASAAGVGNALGTGLLTSVFTTCNQLQELVITNLTTSLSVSGARLSAAELNALYTSLPAVSTTNLLSANMASVETSVTDWQGTRVNASAPTATTPSSQYNVFDGAKVLSTSNTAAGLSTSESSTRVAVSPNAQYTALATLFSSAPTRPARIGIVWYDSGNAVIRTDLGADTSSSGVQLSVTATSPANAATAALLLSHTPVGAASAILWDKFGLFPGTVSTWQQGIGAWNVNVTSNWGAALDDTSIATAKGWTVTG